MDSVITQVSAPVVAATTTGQQPNVSSSNNPNINNSSSNNNPLLINNNESDSSLAALSTSAAAATALQNTSLSYNGQKATKKRSRRNFLCSLICCLSKKGSKEKDKDGCCGGGGNNSNNQLGFGGDAPDNGSNNSNNRAVAAGASSNKGKQLLPELRADHTGRKCIVIDLDETLVHSSFKPISNADFIVPVEIDGTIHQVYVLKRPHVDEFLCRMGEVYECVLFTASLAKYADPVADLLDKWDVFHSRLFRESCVFHRGNYVKDLGRLGRELHRVIIVDNSPASYIFHPDNAVPVSSWFDDMNDRELLDLIPFLETLAKADSVYALLHSKFKANNGNSTAAEVGLHKN